MVKNKKNNGAKHKASTAANGSYSDSESLCSDAPSLCDVKNGIKRNAKTHMNSACALEEMVDRLVDSKPNKAGQYVKKILDILQHCYEPAIIMRCHETLIWQIISHVKRASAAEALVGFDCLGAVLLYVGQNRLALTVYEDIERVLLSLIRTAKQPSVRGSAAKLYGFLAAIGCECDSKLEDATKWFCREALGIFRLAPQAIQKSYSECHNKLKCTGSCLSGPSLERSSSRNPRRGSYCSLTGAMALAEIGDDEEEGEEGQGRGKDAVQATVRQDTEDPSLPAANDENEIWANKNKNSGLVSSHNEDNVSLGSTDSVSSSTTATTSATRGLKAHRNNNGNNNNTSIDNINNNNDNKTSADVSADEQDISQTATTATVADVVPEVDSHIADTRSSRYVRDDISQWVIPLDSAVQAEGFIEGWTLVTSARHHSELARFSKFPTSELFSYARFVIENSSSQAHAAAEAAAVTMALIIHALWESERVTCLEELERDCVMGDVLASLQELSRKLTGPRVTGGEKESGQMMRSILTCAKSGTPLSVTKSLETAHARVVTFSGISFFLYSVCKEFLKDSFCRCLAARDSTMMELLKIDGSDLPSRSHVGVSEKNISMCTSADFRVSEKQRCEMRKSGRALKHSSLWATEEC